MRRRAAVAAGVLAAVVALVAGCGDDSSSPQRTVTVVGTGTVTGTPDTVRADIGIEATGSDVSAALNQANTKVRAVTDAVVAAGVARKDVQTQQVTLTPQYSSPAPGGTSQITGYQATNTIRVIIRDIPKASGVLSAAVNAGGNETRISNVTFAIDDDSALMKQARETAFKDARSRAEQYASLADDSLGDVITINETTSGGQQPAPTYQRDVAAAPVPLEPGQQRLTFTVTVTYALT
ncbi:SIMPL domain-containing protein [Gordonia sp. ABSL49_1]|uniref:SIMPL domain-containing protein n=1 Tax=Gordonia sp. ABSL49_1 TaxID=2920941 RepID=UPI001F0D7B54|nr:SIMPL domain-containing protein [Gordonia sp. ABSL49_1]MCH5644270.1 SIMPL domain-containing protein [Gordonia sp. ABSL49_1]